jgi:hypothetical protein
MAKSFWQGLLSALVGGIVAVILISLVFKLTWQNKEHILILGYSALGTLCLIYVKQSNMIKKKERQDIDDKINEIKQDNQTQHIEIKKEINEKLDIILGFVQNVPNNKK